MAGVQCVCVCASVFACGCPGEAVGGVCPREVFSVCGRSFVSVSCWQRYHSQPKDGLSGAREGT